MRDEYSEVFENYIKIAKEKDSDKDNKKSEPKDITKLYYNGDYLDYEKCIMQEAHPNKVIVAPSYDPINSLVENNIERQKIMLNIVKKNPTGQNTYQKYAESHQELVMSLIKVANELDFKDKDNLRILADSCLDTLKKKSNLVKKANPIAAIGAGPIIGGVAMIIGLLYAQQHLPAMSQGLEINYTNLNEEIDDLINSDITLGKGVEYNSGFIDIVKELKDKTNKVYLECSKISKIINYLDKPRSASEAIEMAKQESSKNLPKVYEMFEKIYNEYNSYFNDVVSKFSNEEYKLRQIKDKGIFDKALQYGMVGGKSLVGDDFDDVKKKLQAFQKSFSDYLNVLKSATQTKDKALQDLSSVQQTSAPEKPKEKEEKKPEIEMPKAKQQPKQKSQKEIENEEFLKDLNEWSNSIKY